jgi:hypothetical protein
MIINKQLLSIPPFISTSWKDVELLLSDGQHTLNIYLKNGTLVKISHLLKEQLDLIFNVHQEILLTQAQDLAAPLIDPLFFQFSGPFLEHDPELSDANPLPDEVKARLQSLLEGLPKIDSAKLPQPILGCNCPHCQLMTLINVPKNEEEYVDDEELKFASWDVNQLSDHLFKLTHPYDETDIYYVSLESPISCTCGEKNCEHIEHILRN